MQANCCFQISFCFCCISFILVCPNCDDDDDDEEVENEEEKANKFGRI